MAGEEVQGFRALTTGCGRPNFPPAGAARSRRDREGGEAPLEGFHGPTPRCWSGASRGGSITRGGNVGWGAYASGSILWHDSRVEELTSAREGVVNPGMKRGERR